MIIYFYLSVVIVLSIITGVITTIIDSKNPNKNSCVIKGIKKSNNTYIPVSESTVEINKSFDNHNNHTEILELTEEYTDTNEEHDSDYYTPVIISVFDQDAI